MLWSRASVVSGLSCAVVIMSHHSVAGFHVLLLSKKNGMTSNLSTEVCITAWNHHSCSYTVSFVVLYSMHFSTSRSNRILQYSVLYFSAFCLRDTDCRRCSEPLSQVVLHRTVGSFEPSFSTCGLRSSCYESTSTSM